MQYLSFADIERLRKVQEFFAANPDKCYVRTWASLNDETGEFTSYCIGGRLVHDRVGSDEFRNLFMACRQGRHVDQDFSQFAIMAKECIGHHLDADGLFSLASWPSDLMVELANSPIRTPEYAAVVNKMIDYFIVKNTAPVVEHAPEVTMQQYVDFVTHHVGIEDEEMAEVAELMGVD